MLGITYIRNLHNLSLQDLGNILGVTKSIISKWERSEKPIPIKRIDQLSKHFKLPAEYFQKELDEIDKLNLQSIQTRNEIDETAYQYDVIGQDDYGNEIVYTGTYLDDSSVEKLRQTNSLIDKEITLKKINKFLSQKLDNDIEVFNELFDRFADVVAAADYYSFIPSLFKIIRTLEKRLNVNVRKYGAFGKGNKIGRISIDDDFVIQLDNWMSQNT